MIDLFLYGRVLEYSLLPKSISSTSSAEFPLLVTLLFTQLRSELVLDKLSTFDDKFSISFRISRWFNSVSLRRFEILFSILLEMSSKSLSDSRVFSSLVELAISSSIWLVDWSLLSFRFWDFSGIISKILVDNTQLDWMTIIVTEVGRLVGQSIKIKCN